MNPMTDPLLDRQNRIKPEWAKVLEDVKKQCQSCFEWFITSQRWAQRCPECKRLDKPKRKQIINEKHYDEKPF
jgi:hypothetical protein